MCSLGPFIPVGLTLKERIPFPAHVHTGKFSPSDRYHSGCRPDHLYVDHHYPGAVVMGQSRPLQSDRPISIQYHRTGHGSSAPASSHLGDGNRFFTDRGHSGHHVFKNIRGPIFV